MRMCKRFLDPSLRRVVQETTLNKSPFLSALPANIKVIKDILIKVYYNHYCKHLWLGMHIKYIIITIINTYNWNGIESMKMISIQLKLLNKAARENNASLISYAATTITPLTEATNWDEGLRDKLMSEHVLRRGGMRSARNPVLNDITGIAVLRA